LAISSVVLVKKLDEAVAQASLAESPLHFGDQVVSPALNATFRLQEWSELGFYFVVSTSRKGEASTDLIIRKEGNPIGHMGERPLPPPDSRGQIKYLAGLPVQSMEAGNYEVEVIVRQGEQLTRSKTLFSLQ
jgi:hypothetical protein